MYNILSEIFHGIIWAKIIFFNTNAIDQVPSLVLHVCYTYAYLSITTYIYIWGKLNPVYKYTDSNYVHYRVTMHIM